MVVPVSLIKNVGDSVLISLLENSRSSIWTLVMYFSWKIHESVACLGIGMVLGSAMII